MNILLLGENGQLGTELRQHLSSLGTVYSFGREEKNGLTGNLEDLASLSNTIHTLKPNIIVNAAAHTAVDLAESDQERAYAINAKAPALLAREAKEVNALLIHYSTDYVFDGSGVTPWIETDKPSPLNVYGASKLEGEQSIIASGCTYYILRTSWVYSAHGDNFAKKMLRFFGEREEMKIINDQIGCPTNVSFLTDCTMQIIKIDGEDKRLGGLYHLTEKGEISWYDYARFVHQTAQVNGAVLKTSVDRILPVSSDAFVTAAKRPLNSRLNCTKFCQTFGIEQPDWSIGVKRMIEKTIKG